MKMIILFIIIGWAVERAQMVSSAWNYGTIYNGIGAADSIMRRDIKAPMAYRVLVPILLSFIEKLTGVKRIVIYEILKWFLNSATLYAIYMAFGLSTAMVSALLFLVTFKYDYWDWAPEVIGVMFAMTGNLALAVAGGVLHAMSRETAPLTPLMFFLVTGNIAHTAIITAATLGTMAVVRIIVGKRELYCDRVMVKRNAKELIESMKYYPVFFSEGVISIVLTVFGIAGGVQLGGLFIVPLATAVAGWTLAVASETRVFAVLVPFAANLLVGVLIA